MKKNLSVISAWALAFGCSIGWGAFIMPGTTFLPKSGIMGTILGIVIGAMIMLIIAWNYHTMIRQFPVDGGAFTYTTQAFGYDHGFLCAWFLCLTYIALIWANASAMALLVRYTLGGVLQFGFHYQIAGYDVYFGETLLCILTMVFAALVCMLRRRAAYILQSVFAIILLAGIFVSFAGSAVTHTGGAASIAPLFTPGTVPAAQVIRLIAIIPWAFVGFESISHSAGEFSFSPRKAFKIMALAVGASAMAYILLLLTAVLKLPEGYESWVQYIADLGNLSGREAMPTFSAVWHTFGKGGVVLLGCTMMCALFTSVIGNMIAASRLLYALAEDEVLPGWFGKLNRDASPGNAILFILLISVFIPFLGRTAVGWHVDVSNVGATVAYGYTSVAAWQWAKRSRDLRTRVCGIAGLAVSGLFLFLLLVPNYFTGNALETESYLILTGWVVLGFALYRQVFKYDRKNRFGKTTAVWVALLFLGLFTAISWQRQASLNATSRTLTQIENEHDGVVHELTENGSGSVDLQEHSVAYNAFLEEKMAGLQRSHLLNSGLVLGIVLLTVSILISNYSILSKKNQEQERTIGAVQKIANTDALTGVKNKNAYNEKEEMLNQRIAEGTQEPFAVVICDVNNLKTVNDTLGHKAGDAYIREGCRLVCNAFKHSPVYRIGGDEFVAILEGSDFALRGELLRELEEQMRRNLAEGKIALATGMADYIAGSDRFLLDVFERADAIMYETKKNMKGMK